MFLDLIIRGLSFVVLINTLFLVMYNIRSKFSIISFFVEECELVLMGSFILKFSIFFVESCE